MKTYYSAGLSAVELASIIGGSDSFGKDAGQFLGGAAGTAVSLPWWASFLPSSLTASIIIVGGLAAASE